MQRLRGADLFGMVADGHGTVVSQGIVPARRLGQPVDLVQVCEQQGARLLRRVSQPIEKNLLAAVLCPQSNHVTFIGDHVIELELAKKSAQRRIGLALFLAGLDGNRQMTTVGELPAVYRLGDQTGPRARKEHIQSYDLIEMVSSRLP